MNPPGSLAPGFTARKAAARLLAGVLARRRSLADQIADPAGALAGLDPPERARAQSLATMALRHLGKIDRFLAGYFERPPAPAAMNALRIAVAEIRLDGVPAHAAVDNAVRLVRADPKVRHLAGFVNAVARRAAAAEPEAWEAVPEAGLPDWITGPVRRAWGEGVLVGIAAAHAEVPPLDLTSRDPGMAGALAARLGAELLPTGSLRLRRAGQVSGLPGYNEGEWWVQDAAAAVPARLLGDLKGAAALDLCAAPGGKTLQLAAAGAEVTALDASPTRLKRLEENLVRTGLNARIVIADALSWQPDRLFDAILLDPPCTATGTIRRHPDLLYVRSAAEVRPLRHLQRALLGRAWEWLRPGGRLVHCTCSLLPEEGEELAADFAVTTPGARPVRPDAGTLGLEPQWVDTMGGLRLRPDYWPERGGMDGFHAAVWEKIATTA